MSASAFELFSSTNLDVLKGRVIIKVQGHWTLEKKSGVDFALNPRSRHSHPNRNPSCGFHHAWRQLHEFGFAQAG